MAENKSTRGLIIIGYPGIGKTTLANSSTSRMGSRSEEIIDLESSIFNVDGERDENWYVVYCRLAISFARQGYTVLTSSHQEVINEFKRYEPSNEYSIFVIVPHKDLKDEWTKKLLERYKKDNSQKNGNALKRVQEFFVSDIELLSMQHYFSVIFIESMNYNLDAMIDCMQYLVDTVS